jgi:NitT/TauT family transport system substrate-binding protein
MRRIAMRPTCRRVIAGAALAITNLWMVAALTQPSIARELLLAEPVHHVGFLPIYVAQHKGYFKDEGIDLTTSVLPAGGFVAAVLSGEAFAYIASVDHNAFARANGKSLMAVSNLVARANIYMMARTDMPPMTGDLPSYLKGKRIAVAAYGSTPNNVLRYFLKKWNLDPIQDVTLIEVTNSSAVPASIKAKQADLGVSSEPFITQLYKAGLWTQPIFNAGKELGPFVDTVAPYRRSSPDSCGGKRVAPFYPKWSPLGDRIGRQLLRCGLSLLARNRLVANGRRGSFVR